MKNKSKINLKDKGITLVALVVTIIVLLILAGVTIQMVLGQNGVIEKAKQANYIDRKAKVEQEIEQGRGYAQTYKQTDSGDFYEKLVEYLNNSQTLKSVSNNGRVNARKELQNVLLEVGDDFVYIITENDTIFIDPSDTPQHIPEPIPIGPGQVIPETTDGYFGESVHNEGDMVEAKDLEVGDVIKYVYDSEKDPINCEVIYNDATNGIQIISLDTVKDVTLGKGDPLAQSHTTLEGGKPEQITYQTNPDAIKAVWSYNHAIATLNNYAQEYIGNLAISARCVGCPADNVILTEDLTDNVYGQGTNLSVNGMFKNGDDNIYGTNQTAAGRVSDDFARLDSLEIIKCYSSQSYWIASRFTEQYYKNYNCSFGVRSMYGDRFADDSYLEYIEGAENVLCAYKNISPSTTAVEIPRNSSSNEFTTRGLRPIITLKPNVELEFVGHAVSGPGGFSEPVL